MSTAVELVFDLEADGWRDEATRAWCICTIDVNTRVRNGFDPDCINQGIDFLNTATHLIGHNILDYDLPLLKRLYGWTPKVGTKITDTVVKSRLLRSDRPLPYGAPGNLGPHSLGAWGYRVGRGKPDHDDWSKFTPEMLHRCEEDTEINLLVHLALEKEERSNPLINWRSSIQLEHDIAPVITEQEQNGVPLDLPLVWKTRNTLKAKISAIDKEVVPLLPQRPLPKSKQGTWPSVQFKKNGEPTVNALRYYGEDFGKERKYRTDLVVKKAPINLGSEKQVKEYLMTIGWVPTEWNFKKDSFGKPLRGPDGQRIKSSPRLTLDSLESCRFPDGYEEIGAKIVDRLMLAHRESMLRGWLRDCDANGIISAKAIPMGTPTSRMTHRGVVNVPRNSSPYGTELRSCFTTLPGYTRVGIDLASCQLRGLSHYLRDEEHRFQVVEGDPHTHTAKLAKLMDRPSPRDDGKKINYTVLFGGSAEKVATDLGIPVAQAKMIIEALFAALPALPELLRRLEAEWKQKGYITGIDGRAIFVRSKHMLLVYLLQCLEAVVIKRFIVLVYNAAKEAGLDFMLVTTMHDECQWLVKDAHVALFKMIAEAAIETVNNEYDLWCPQGIDIHTGATWSECH